MYPFYWTSSERGTYQLSGRLLVTASGTNDNILRIIPQDFLLSSHRGK